VKSKKTTRITVSLPDDEHASLSNLAEKYDVSLSWLTRKAVVEFLKDHDEGGRQVVVDLPIQHSKTSRIS